MICPGSNPSPRRPSGAGRRPRGFTLVELLVVMLVLALLIALLLPALNGALRTARNSAVNSEINQLAQALNAFKTKYGEYPPSRIFLNENGDFRPVGSNTDMYVPNASADINVGQLAQRSVAALRKYFPSVQLVTSGSVVLFPANSNQWYDFNGNGVFDPKPYILEGHQCLVFFLGGIPLPTGSGFGMTGFGKNPANPFTNSIPTSTMYSNNRQAPFFEFDPGRLVLDPTDPYSGSSVDGALQPSSVPGYLDSLGNGVPTGLVGSPVNFYAYFSSYGNGGYDPNDVNFVEQDSLLNGPIGLAFNVPFVVHGGTAFGAASNNIAVSPAPNPYTSSVSVSPSGSTSTYLNPQTFQIICSGVDGLYGVGGQYVSNTTGEALPVDTTNVKNYVPALEDQSIRFRERDNISNFHNGKLE
jgi:general secretion pathway protein G